MTEGTRSGTDHLHAATALLQRRRNSHPTVGLYEAAELQWFWSTPRPTDELEQLYWFDDDGVPEAAALLFDFSGGGSLLYDEVTFCPLTLPGAPAQRVHEVVERGLDYAAEQGVTSVEVEVSRADTVMQTVLADRGFSVKGEFVLTEAWLDVNDRPEASPIADGYRLTNRTELAGTPHHMDSEGRNIEERLAQLTLYSPDLDLVILDRDGVHAAHCICWYDPVTEVGVIEPVRTQDGHQKRGLARHLITSGIEAMVDKGAKRIAIGWEPDNPASSHLYQDIGFVLATEIDTYAGPTTHI